MHHAHNFWAYIWQRKLTGTAHFGGCRIHQRTFFSFFATCQRVGIRVVRSHGHNVPSEALLVDAASRPFCTITLLTAIITHHKSVITMHHAHNFWAYIWPRELTGTAHFGWCRIHQCTFFSFFATCQRVGIWVVRSHGHEVPSEALLVDAAPRPFCTFTRLTAIITYYESVITMHHAHNFWAYILGHCLSARRAIPIWHATFIGARRAIPIWYSTFIDYVFWQQCATNNSRCWNNHCT